MMSNAQPAKNVLAGSRRFVRSLLCPFNGPRV
jgi:hypothetical protein